MQSVNLEVPIPVNPAVSELGTRVKCLACDMIQLEAEWCRRCKKKLPRPVTREVIKEVHTVVTMDVSLFGPTAPILPMDEYERLAIIHALKQCKSASEAAQALKIGKTQIYRKFKWYKIDVNKYARRRRKPSRAASTADMRVASAQEIARNRVLA